MTVQKYKNEVAVIYVQKNQTTKRWIYQTNLLPMYGINIKTSKRHIFCGATYRIKKTTQKLKKAFKLFSVLSFQVLYDDQFRRRKNLDVFPSWCPIAEKMVFRRLYIYYMLIYTYIYIYIFIYIYIYMCVYIYIYIFIYIYIYIYIYIFNVKNNNFI